MPPVALVVGLLVELAVAVAVAVAVAAPVGIAVQLTGFVFVLLVEPLVLVG